MSIFFYSDFQFRWAGFWILHLDGRFNDFPHSAKNKYQKDSTNLLFDLVRIFKLCEFWSTCSPCRARCVFYWCYQYTLHLRRIHYTIIIPKSIAYDNWIESMRALFCSAPLFLFTAWLFIGILLAFIRSTFHLFCCHYLIMIYACCARSRLFMRITSISCCAFPFKFDTKNARVLIRSHVSLTIPNRTKNHH